MQDIENEIDFELACNTRHKVLEGTGMSMDWLLKNCSREINLITERMATLKTDSAIEAAYTLWCQWMDEDGQLADLSTSRLMVVATFIRDKKITVPAGGCEALKAREPVRFCKIGDHLASHEPEWKRSAAMMNDGTVLMPAALLGPENIVYILACNEGIPVVLSVGHLFVPAEWGAQIRSDSEDIKDMIKGMIKNVRKFFGVKA